MAMYIWELHKYDRCSNPFAMCEHQTFFRYLVIISHHQQRYRNHYYHHHQNHHHKHQLDKTIRVARVTTVVSHSARTPSIVKGNKSLKISHLVWSKWGSQWWSSSICCYLPLVEWLISQWGILKHFPQSIWIFICHWPREK